MSHFDKFSVLYLELGGNLTLINSITSISKHVIISWNRIGLLIT